MTKNKKLDYCTVKNSLSYSNRFKNYSKDAYNLNHQFLSLSSIGFGMYKGNYEINDRKQYQKIIKNFILKGVNVFDTARKYRNGFSEQDFGIAFLSLLNNSQL